MDKITLGRTINTGDFNSIRVDVEINRISGEPREEFTFRAFIELKYVIDKFQEINDIKN